MEKGTPLQKLLHTFAALADLGQEIADTHDFDEKMRAALHLVQGSLGIMRCALAIFDSEKQALSFIAARGMGQTFPPDLLLKGGERASQITHRLARRPNVAHRECHLVSVVQTVR